MILHSKITPERPQITTDHTRSSQNQNPYSVTLWLCVTLLLRGMNLYFSADCVWCGAMLRIKLVTRRPLEMKAATTIEEKIEREEKSPWRFSKLSHILMIFWLRWEIVKVTVSFPEHARKASDSGNYTILVSMWCCGKVTHCIRTKVQGSWK